MPRRRSRAELERHIGSLGRAFGWRHHHARCPGLTRDGYPDGFPGEVLLRGERLVFLSIAGASGVLTPPAMRWVEGLGAVRCVEAHIINRDKPSTVAVILNGNEQDAQPRGDASSAEPQEGFA